QACKPLSIASSTRPLPETRPGPGRSSATTSPSTRRWESRGARAPGTVGCSTFAPRPTRGASPRGRTRTSRLGFRRCSTPTAPGGDIMAQGWYQGGISVFDWTDAAHPKEIAYYDRGPMDSTKLVGAGSWSAYWYNGYIVSSEIGRGLDVFELVPSGLLSQNEIDAAKLVHFDYLNVQDQPKLVWPASFVVARAYLDQLARSNGL